MNRVEDFVAPNGRRWSDIRKKKPKKDLAAKAWSRIQRTTQKQRKAEKDKALAEKKLALWDSETAGWGLAAAGWKIPRPICLLCDLPIQLYGDCAACHRTSRGMGGGKRNDADIFLGHHVCNLAQGSMSLPAYLAKFSLAERQRICKGECP